jgi:hypothetical protein
MERNENVMAVPMIKMNLFTMTSNMMMRMMMMSDGVNSNDKED